MFCLTAGPGAFARDIVNRIQQEVISAMLYRRPDFTFAEWLAAVLFVSIWVVLLLHAARKISEAAPRPSRQDTLVPESQSLQGGTMPSRMASAEGAHRQDSSGWLQSETELYWAKCVPYLLDSRPALIIVPGDF
jgi:hypothetical protein